MVQHRPKPGAPHKPASASSEQRLNARPLWSRRGRSVPRCPARNSGTAGTVPGRPRGRIAARAGTPNFAGIRRRRTARGLRPPVCRRPDGQGRSNGTACTISGRQSMPCRFADRTALFREKVPLDRLANIVAEAPCLACFRHAVHDGPREGRRSLVRRRVGRSGYFTEAHAAPCRKTAGKIGEGASQRGLKTGIASGSIMCAPLQGGIQRCQHYCASLSLARNKAGSGPGRNPPA